MSPEKSRVGSISCRFLAGLASAGVLVISALVLAGCGGPVNGEDAVAGNATHPVAMAQKYTVDGTVDFSTFATVNSQVVTINDETGTAVQVSELRWAMDNDDRNLYLALEWQDLTQNNGYDLSSGPTDYDGIRVMFDVDGNGTFAEGEDMHTLIAASIGSLYRDQHNVAAGSDASDLIGDGYGKLTYNPTTQKYQAELMLPMRQDAQGQDGNLTSATRINFVVYDHVTSPDNDHVTAPTTGNAGYLFGSSTSTGAWPTIAVTSSTGYIHPAVPGGLTGLVAFIGEQDVPVGEVYTMNPATGAVRRVTAHANLYKDKVSLSHDRTRVAFEGVLCNFASETLAQCKQRSNDYEIYRIDVDGRNFTKLTANATGDRHPAWSPDDQHLVYTSFRNGSNGAVVTMDTAGVEAADLSSTGDDRDPDYLPDGRIVFATNLFTDSYKSRIAVMSDTGGNLAQLTNTAGVSDHAPMGNASQAVFERFSLDLDPATAVESLFAPWDLGAVQLTGTESLLLADGWLNRQPVIDPSGNYVAYLKNTGYNAAQLMGSDGTPYGRFIADITTIRSLDWK